MKVSVIVPVYNEENYLAPCLQSLIDQQVKADEIILVDNNSTDKSVAIAKHFPVRIVHEKEQGMIPARNRGFNEAKYDLILRTDADTRVHTDWIKRIKQEFIKNKELVALSGPAHFYGVPKIVPAADWPTNLFFSLFNQIIGHDCLFGPNMALRRTAWDLVKNEVCLDDEKVHEDIDLALHIAKYGQVKFDTDLIVTSSFRRWKKITPYYEYPYRAIKTIQQHRQAVLLANRKRIMASSMLPQTKKIIKRLRSITLTGE